MKTRTFYRVNHHATWQGLWYDFAGKFTGFIHNKFDFCSNSNLVMDFDPEIVGYVSTVEALDDLYKWFTKDDILRLQEDGWYVHEYESDDYKFYDRFQHYVAKQSSLTNKRRFLLAPGTDLILKEGAYYRAKRPRSSERDSEGDILNDRKILWMSEYGHELQYDGPSVPIGRNYPKVSVAKFLNWAGREIAPEEYTRKVVK